MGRAATAGSRCWARPAAAQEVEISLRSSVRLRESQNRIVQEIVRRVVRIRVAGWILMVGVVGLLGCPQLLDDNFGTARLSTSDAGSLCLDGACGVPHSGGSAGELGQGGSWSGAAGQGGANTGGAAGGAGAGSTGSGGSWWGGSGNGGSSWTAGASGSAGAAGSAGQGGSAGSGSVTTCRTLEMTSSAADASSNCVGIVSRGRLDVHPDSTVSLSYVDGNPCFTGTIATTGWGALYNLYFTADSSLWDATSDGVTGFRFLSSGVLQVPVINVYYKAPDGVDYCRTIAPGDVAVPFADAHPACSTNASSPIVDTTNMEEVELAILPGDGSPYSVDFCMQITALE